MWRYGAGVVSALLLATAGVFLFRGSAQVEGPLPPPRPMSHAPAPLPPEPITVPSASPRTREQKRFDRYDKDRNGSVTREEYLASRRKAYARLDLDHDGQLSFEEWATRTTTKFAKADADRSAALNPAEFAATAVPRKPTVRCACPPAATEGDE
ncbi:histidine kinase [Sphingomonas sp. PL-96]|uniref:EF-hand domain-containing protein n=1 Tax=Sphingomonas sp. PL-96 TaxID=2887201 RepID=UPI001E3DDB46|nr:EF-hand domain-containing protein [Sphingomonas sp. PL-96]MCC2976715.1 histidine kinase [Sphingomonas sp. PL-96]